MSTVAASRDNLQGVHALEECMRFPRLDGLAGDLLCLLAVPCNPLAQHLKLVLPLFSCSHMFSQARLQLFVGGLCSFDLRRQGSGSLELLLQGFQLPVFLVKLAAVVVVAPDDSQLVLLRAQVLDVACQPFDLH